MVGGKCDICVVYITWYILVHAISRCLTIQTCVQGDSLGYDVLVVDAMHKANFASRLCHSCRPNCEAK